MQHRRLGIWPGRFPRGMLGALVLILLLGGARPATAQDTATAAPRGPQLLAFVVGVDAYDNLGPDQQLTRAGRDANDVARALTGLGFKVAGGVGIDVGRDEFMRRWKAFVAQIEPGRNDTAVVFLAGHGMTIEGRSYFFPRNAPFKRAGRQGELERESILLVEMLLDLQERRPRFSLMIIDACRTNPFIPAGFRASGLGGVSVTGDGVLVVYSAGGHEVALDRLPGLPPDPSANSVFARVLVPMLEGLGTKVEPIYQGWVQELQKRVRELASAAGVKQTPRYYSGLEGEFCLLGDCSGPTRLGAAAIDWRGQSSCDAWRSLRQGGLFPVSDGELLDFLGRFRGQPCAEEARALLESRARSQATLHVLSIGVGMFRDASIPPMPGVVRDAREVASALGRRGASVYGRVRSEVVTGGDDATRDGLLAKLARLQQEAKASDVVLVYVSGLVREVDGAAYLIPWDAKSGDTRSYLALSQLQGLLGRTFGHRVLLLDSCGAGIANSIQASLVAPSEDDQISVIAASLPQPMACDRRGGEAGVFASALLHAVNHGGADAKRPPLTIGSLGRSVAMQVSKAAAKPGIRQVPYWTSDRKDFVIYP